MYYLLFHLWVNHILGNWRFRFYLSKKIILLKVKTFREQLHSEIVKNVKFLRNGDIDILLEKLSKTDYLQISQESNYGLLVPILMKNDKVQFDREMMQFFESNLLKHGKLESYEEAMKSLDKYGGSWNSRLRFNR